MLTLLGLLKYLSYVAQDYLPRDVTVYSELGPHTSIIDQENDPRDLPTGSSDGGKSSIESPPSLECGDDNHPQPSQSMYEYDMHSCNKSRTRYRRDGEKTERP